MARMPILERFLKYVSPEPNSGCWLWAGECNVATGYGMIRIAHIQRSAHRVSYELHKGPIPAGLDLDHLCRMRCCVNPDHLEPVTRRENLRRGRHDHLALGSAAFAAMQRAKTHCVRGHEFNEQNTRWYQGKHGKCRSCRECSNMRNRALYAKQKRKYLNG